MTSNLGAGQAKRPLGFAGGEAAPAGDRMLEAAKRAFLPEFVNRIDEVVVFEALTEAQIGAIGELMIERIAARLRAERGIELTVAPELIVRLARDGFDPEFGARPLKRHIRRTLERELTRAILSGELSDGSRVVARSGEDGAIALDVRAAALAA
jgi:ATP-dependent Clp protease ATP-binding subunit ClpC